MLRAQMAHTPSSFSCAVDRFADQGSRTTNGHNTCDQTNRQTQPVCSAASLALAHINFEGNIIPMAWFGHITFASNKADLLAINILADIVYWYRPTAVRDERTGDFHRLPSEVQARSALHQVR